MKKMLLSMKPYWKDKIMSEEKIYEYRTRFTDEETISGFVVPQSYIYIKEGSELEKLLDTSLELEEKIVNNIEGRGANEVCRNY